MNIVAVYDLESMEGNKTLQKLAHAIYIDFFFRKQTLKISLEKI